MAKFGSCMSLETSLKSWPYPDMPGFPLNHEQDGLHYIGDAVAFWCARKKKWSLLCRTREEKPEWLIKQNWAEYRGPCFNIDEWEKSVSETQRLLAERDEAIAALALYRAENGCTRGQRTTQWCGEATKVRRAWLRVIQIENGCPASGGGCLSQQCGCVAEMELLLEDGR